FVQGKRTFPLLAAWVRASESERAELETLWNLPPVKKDAAALAKARGLVESLGGLAATERAISRSTRAAHRALGSLPDSEGVRALLADLVGHLARRRV